MIRVSDRAGLCGLGTRLVVELLATSESEARAATFTDLSLQNGWVTAPFGTRNAGVRMVGIVSFTGASASGMTGICYLGASKITKGALLTSCHKEHRGIAYPVMHAHPSGFVA